MIRGCGLAHALVTVAVHVVWAGTLFASYLSTMVFASPCPSFHLPPPLRIRGIASSGMASHLIRFRSSPLP
ncbi:unnamed protein product [Taenia asiatica]|uniref:Secreted protein n=1 Tax=Taenia asiatica TaxID=60517 RepID=A0A0R3WG78_TAEAS|nr:unnamed protein product [Taenia asiatica]